MMNEDKKLTPWLPLYDHLKHCIRTWEGEKKDDVYGLINEIDRQTGTPQNPVDWSDPDTWIPERLAGEHRRLAEKYGQAAKRLLIPGT